MRGFTAHEGGWQAILEPEEARILLSLSAQLQQLLADGLGGDAEADAALHRVLPNAYRNDAEAETEWRQLSRRGLVERKISFARTMARQLAEVAAADGARPVQVNESEAMDWMRAVGDLRLVLADKLGIVVDGDEGLSELEGLRELYDWLAWIQDDLVRALDGA